MFGLSFAEATLILVVALIVLGPKRLPQVIQMLGQGLRALQRSSSGLRDAFEEPLREVREPIEQMQRDLYRTVHHFERQVQTAATELATVAQDAPATAERPALPAEADLPATEDAREQPAKDPPS